jgi:hypothetical protein
MTETTKADHVEQVKEQAVALFDRAKERLKPVDEWVRTTTREHPVLLLAGAFGVGYLVARLLRRR